MNRLLAIAAVSALSISSAYAFPGEAITVVRHCGQPANESISTNQSTNRLERNLTYGDTTLLFVPGGGDWTFTSAFKGEVPVSSDALQQEMPCFRAALDDTAGNPAPATDTATVSRVPATASMSGVIWGIPHLPTILLLAFLLGVMLLIPGRKTEASEDLRMPRLTRRSGAPIPAHRRRNHLTA